MGSSKKDKEQKEISPCMLKILSISATLYRLGQNVRNTTNDVHISIKHKQDDI